MDYAQVLESLRADEQQQATTLERTRSAIAAIEPLAAVKKRREPSAPKVTPRRTVKKATRRSAKSKLTDRQVAEMKQLYESGEKNSLLAKRYGITDQAVSYYAKKRGWKRGKPKSAKCPGCGQTVRTHPCPVCKHDSEALAGALK